MVVGLLALVAYRKHRKTKRETEMIMASIANTVKELASFTGLDYKTLAYDEDLLDLISIDADWDELLEYVDNNY